MAKHRVGIRVKGSDRPEKTAALVKSAIGKVLKGHGVKVQADQSSIFEKNGNGEKVTYLDIDIVRVGADEGKVWAAVATVGAIVSNREYNKGVKKK